MTADLSSEDFLRNQERTSEPVTRWLGVQSFCGRETKMSELVRDREQESFSSVLGVVAPEYRAQVESLRAILKARPEMSASE